MKTILILGFLLFFLCFCCKKENKIESTLILKETLYGGCFNKNFKSSNITSNGVSYSTNDDTISLDIEFKDNCGGKFLTENSTRNDSIFVFINDTSELGAYCTCNFSIINKYIGFRSNKLYHYFVYLKTLNAPDYILYGSGSIIK